MGLGLFAALVCAAIFHCGDSTVIYRHTYAWMPRAVYLMPGTSRTVYVWTSPPVNSASVTWLHNGQVCQNGGKYSFYVQSGGQKLIWKISNIVEADAGKLTLKIAGVARDFTSNLIMMQQPLRLHLKGHVGVVGQTATFDATFSRPIEPSKVVWHHQGREVTNGGRYILTTSQSGLKHKLQIGNTKLADSGEVKVGVKNSRLAVRILMKIGPPSVRMRWTNAVSAGQNATFSGIFSVPVGPNDFTWHHNGQTVSNNGKYTTSVTNGGHRVQLTIKTEKGDSGSVVLRVPKFNTANVFPFYVYTAWG